MDAGADNDGNEEFVERKSGGVSLEENVGHRQTINLQKSKESTRYYDHFASAFFFGCGSGSIAFAPLR